MNTLVLPQRTTINGALYAFLLIYICSQIGQAQSIINTGTGNVENFYTIQSQFDSLWKDKDLQTTKGWKQFKRWEEFWSKRVYPTGVFPAPTILWDEWQKLQEPSKNTSLLRSTPAWSILGPINSIPQNGGSGRINCVRFNPRNFNNLWVGSPAGGLWQTTNAGLNWTTNTGNLPTLGVTDIALHPTNNNIAYIATGDGWGGHTYSAGVLKTVDGGATWSQTGMNWNVTQNRQSRRLLIHPTQPETIFVGANNAIWRSINGGGSWAQVYVGNVYDMEFHPTNPMIMYATLGGGNNSGRIVRSVNGGTSWSLIEQNTGLAVTGFNRIAIAVTPINPNTIYAICSKNDNSFGGVYVSVDTGATWQLRASTPNILGWNLNGSGAGGQGFYDLCIAASPITPNLLYIGGINIWRSTDGGSSWTANTSWTGNGAPYVHADIHDLVFLPNSNRIYAGCDGGVFTTENNSNTWTDLSSGLQILQCYTIDVDPSNTARVLAGAQDNGSNLRRPDGSWRRSNGGDGMEVFFEPENTGVCYATVYYGTLQRSTNTGESFGSNIAPATGAWVTPFVVNPQNPKGIFGGFKDMYRLPFRGGRSDWVKISNNQTSGANIDCIAVAHNDSALIYFTSNDRLWKTTNGGGTTGRDWVRIGQNNLPSTAITDICIHPRDNNKVVLTYSSFSTGSKVFQSTDGGNTWQNLTKTKLPSVPINCAIFYLDNCGEWLYIGTDLGVFYTHEGMNSWEPFNTNLPNVIIRDFALNGSLLRAGTFGRGIWEVNVLSNVPNALYSVDTNRVCPGQSIQFTDKTTNNPTQFRWEFEGGIPSSSSDRNPLVRYDSTGTYRVRYVVRNSCGVDSINRELDVTVLSASAPSITQRGDTLTATIPGRYQWYRNDEKINGATNRTYIMTDNATYYAIFVNNNGCSTKTFDIVRNVSSVSRSLYDAGFGLYPNPATTQITLTVPDTYQRSLLKISVVSLLGTTLVEKYIQDVESYDINISSLPKGTYFVSCTIQNQIGEKSQNSQESLRFVSTFIK